MLDKLAKYHNDWIRIAYSFLNDKQDAEDVVQDVYLRLYNYNIKYNKIKYGDEVNKYFMYTVIKNECLQFIRKKVKEGIPFTEYDYILWKLDGRDNSKFENPMTRDKIELDLNEPYIDENKILDEIQKEIDTWNWYERTLFEVYCYSGLSLRDLAYGSTKEPRQLSRTKYIKLEAVREGTGISVSSMFHTLKKLKERIRIKFKNYERTGRQED